LARLPCWGAGAVYRAVAELQRAYFVPPTDLEAARDCALERRGRVPGGMSKLRSGPALGRPRELPSRSCVGRSASDARTAVILPWIRGMLSTRKRWLRRMRHVQCPYGLAGCRLHAQRASGAVLFLDTPARTNRGVFLCLPKMSRRSKS
jgi:hypothetical protein